MPTHFDTIVEYINKLPKKSTDDVKINSIKDFILDIDCKDNTKSALITKTKKYLLQNNLVKNNDNLTILNARELYDKLIKENYQKRKKEWLLILILAMLIKYLILEMLKKL